MSKKKDIKLLIDFFSRDLSEEQKEEFLHKATNDPEFLKDFIKGIELDEAYDDLFEEEDKDEPHKPVFRQKQIRLVLYIVAGAAVIVFGLIFGIGQYQRNQDHGEYLYSKYYQVFNGSNFVTRGDQDDPLINFLNGYEQYDAANFESSIQIFHELCQENQHQPVFQLYLGLSLMGAEKYSEAIGVFEACLNRNELYFPEESWYLSLCYIKSGQFAEAKELLYQTGKYDGLYKKQSTELIEKLINLR